MLVCLLDSSFQGTPLKQFTNGGRLFMKQIFGLFCGWKRSSIRSGILACAALSILVAPTFAYAKPCKKSTTHRKVAFDSTNSQVALAAPKKDAPKDIVDTAVGAGSFKTLAAALTAAGLVETLKSKGPFTVFAPTDEAFAKLPAGTIDTLLKPENKKQLANILLLHVVPGTVLAADVVKLTSAKTAGGTEITISADDGVKVGTATGMATVTKTDIKASNGVIHVIDSVILP